MSADTLTMLRRAIGALAVSRREIDTYVDDAELARLEQDVFVPIHLNTASDADILTIPGVGHRLLREFEEYRPYKTRTRRWSSSAAKSGSAWTTRKSPAWNGT